VLILEEVKVICFDAVLQVLISNKIELGNLSTWLSSGLRLEFGG